MFARALAHRDYRLFFSGQAISLIGTWMTRVASSWLVYRLTNDPVMLGVVNFAGLAPSFFLGPLAGVWVDRVRSLKKLIVVTQVAAALQSLGLVAAAALPVAPQTAVAMLVALNLFQGVVNAFDIPARQAFLPFMVTEAKDLSNAIALNSMLFNGARLVGPALAGALIALVGELWCFVIDAASYVAVIGALLAMQANPQRVPKEGERTAVWADLVEGVRYVYAQPTFRSIITLVAILSFLGLPYTVLLPIYAKEVLGGGPRTLGLLTSAAGFGALIGALVLARRPSIEGLTPIIRRAGAAFAVGLAGFALSTSLHLSIALLFATGLGMIMQTASSNTILQTLVEPSKRGRVMSLYVTAFVGMAPFGGLAAGFVAARIGAPRTLAGAAVVCGLSTLVLTRRMQSTLRSASA